MNYLEMVDKINSLPSLCNTALIARRLYDQGAANVNINKLVKAVESDASLSVNILRMINSPLYGFSKQISSVTQAVTLFGTELIYSFIVKHSIGAAIIANLRPYGCSNSLFNEICHMQSNLVSKWYSNVNLADAQFLTPLAFIMESGKLIMAKEITLSGEIKNFSQGLKDAQSISFYEHSVFKTSSYYVSGLLFEHWNFNPIYSDILKGLDYEHGDSKSLQHYIDILDIIRTAVNVKDIFTDESMEEASEMVSDLGLNVDHFISVAKNIKELNKERIV